MGWLNGPYSPVRLARDLPIRVKLAATVVGALLLLTGVSLFALDRLAYVAGLQQRVAAQSAIDHQIQRALIAAQELRVVARELMAQQTTTAVRRALDRAAKQSALASELIDRVRAGPDQPLLDAAQARLDALMNIVRQAGTLRAEMITSRQKRLFQVRPVFEMALNSLADDLDRGSGARGGVASVRDATTQGVADQHDPTVQAATRYRLAMGRLQIAALLFLATGNGAAANDVREAAADAAANMKVILSGPAPDAIKADARLAATIGSGIATSADALIDLSRQLDQLVGTQVEAASRAMQEAFETLASTAADRERHASDSALDAGIAASANIRAMIGGITVLMVVLGWTVIWWLSTPMRRLTGILQTIAAGGTDQQVPYTKWRDEIGRMAKAVEALRGVMRQAFIQSQMIEQLPVGVMTAEPLGQCRITYMNPKARDILHPLRGYLPTQVDQLDGHSMDIFHARPAHQRALIADPSRLPYRARLRLGPETLEVRVSAIHDRDGRYVGPLVIWRALTSQVELETRFEATVGHIARNVLAAAEAMRSAAVTLRHSATAANERTVAVAAASDQAAGSVNTVAAGAEQLAASVAEIGRQVEESTQIAAFAVAEAKATDSSVGSLSEAADRISAVIRLISDVAERTNLLALNATIEAARAGEAGKGFAVVATEVKNLATQTARATDEIGSQIAAIQGATSQAVAALHSIGDTIERMSEITAAIAASVGQQQTATQSIAEAVQHAAAGTAEVNGNIAAVSAEVDETGDRAEAVLEAANGMADQAAMLQQEVARFLISVRQAA